MHHSGIMPQRIQKLMTDRSPAEPASGDAETRISLLPHARCRAWPATCADQRVNNASLATELPCCR